MSTGQTIISNALTHLGLLEQGAVPSVSDSNYGLTVLNSTWDAWGIDEGLIFSVSSKIFLLVAGTPSYAIGLGAAAPFNVARPSRIYKAVMLQTVGAAITRRILRIVNQDQYYSHTDLEASAASAEEIYPDYNVDANGDAALYLWPVPSCPTVTQLELETGVPFTAWTLGGAYLIPEGYQDAIEWALAFKMLPGFGVAVAPAVAQLVAQNASKAEARIRQMNASNRQIPEPASMNPQIQQTPQEQPVQGAPRG